jgi:hypothetical protein
VYPRCSGKRQRRVIPMGSDIWFPVDLHPLVTQELHTSPPMNSPTPVSPEQWLSPDAERMQQHTHLARLRGLIAIPLTLFA